MLASSTVFVIGAGSGFDISMPLGSDLLHMIGAQARFRVEHGRVYEDPQALVYSMFYEEMPDNVARLQQRGNTKEIYDVNVRISQAINLVGSIDDFINLHHGDQNLVRAAKIHIAYSILKSERGSKLMPNPDYEVVTDLTKVGKSWLLDFFRLITKPSISTDPVDIFKNVSIINFNYDRCLEQFLISAIPKLYNINVTDACQIVRSANIIHPYGQVGDLPLLTSSSTSVKFGDNTSSGSVRRASELIKTYTEQVNSNIVTQIKNIVNASSRVIFLGFGFHRQNVDLLSMPASAAMNRSIIGTAFGESDANIVEYGARLLGVGGMIVPGQRMPGRIELLSKLDCASLLQNYREVISS